MSTATKVKKIADFRDEYDRSVRTPRKIQAALAALAKVDKEAWESESDFIRRIGIPSNEFPAFRDQFLDYAVVMNRDTTREKRVWCGTKELAKKLREFTPNA